MNHLQFRGGDSGARDTQKFGLTTQRCCGGTQRDYGRTQKCCGGTQRCWESIQRCCGGTQELWGHPKILGEHPRCCGGTQKCWRNTQGCCGNTLKFWGDTQRCCWGTQELWVHPKMLGGRAGSWDELATAACLSAVCAQIKPWRACSELEIMALQALPRFCLGWVRLFGASWRAAAGGVCSWFEHSSGKSVGKDTGTQR